MEATLVVQKTPETLMDKSITQRSEANICRLTELI
jgi:hypothetical protein